MSAKPVQIAKQKGEIDAALERAYAGQADAMLEEIEPLIEAQAWPTELAVAAGCD